MNTSTRSSDVIPLHECMAKVASAHLGRLAFSHRALPALLPMSYVVDGSDLVLQTAGGPALAAAQGDGCIVAFEVDEIDPLSYTGWSVVVTGRLREVTDSSRVSRYEANPALPWDSDSARHFLLLTPGLVSGRRLPATAALMTVRQGPRDRSFPRTGARGPKGPIRPGNPSLAS
jgi:uncharacterized protein